jgi:diguanylate cyclase (GGDEF)-like protein
MTTRMKWEILNARTSASMGSAGRHLYVLCDLIDSNSLSVFFQPIVSSKNGSVFGYECLSRIKRPDDYPFDDISDLFKNAKELNLISSLDMLCRSNSIKEAAGIGITNKNAYLFINVCPETLMDPDHKMGLTDEIADEFHIPKEKIIFEITEETCIENYKLFKETIAYYRKRGYKIAIDDFGAGHGGLKMLSIIEPDFVKIDRHFISNIDKAMIKFNLVDSMATACHRIGIKVIAEGIETEEELDVVLNMGIELLQGYHIGRPQPGLSGENGVHDHIRRRFSKKSVGLDQACKTIGDISQKVEPLYPETPFSKTMNLFISRPDIRSMPVVEDERIVGMLHRTRFLEQQILGRCGYGIHLNSYKNISTVMEPQFVVAEAGTPLENVVQRINTRKTEFLYDDICVTKNGKYFGTVAVSALLDAITERSLAVARGSNPLTGLPGNVFIQREIEKRLSQRMHFDVCYIDVDNFKPYNDYYGFERGDIVIKTLGSIISDVLLSLGDSDFNFVGHIGGDDFIAITRPQISIKGSESIIDLFTNRLPKFHTPEVCGKGFYITKNRKGEMEEFSLLSLSIGIVSTEVYKIESYAQLASISTEVKKMAKMEKGSAVVRDRRLMGRKD